MSPSAGSSLTDSVTASDHSPTLALVGLDMRVRMHLMAALAVVFLSIYGRVVCPFVDSVDLFKLVAGLCAVGLAQIALRELLYRLFPAPWGRASLARHGMYLATASWVISGLIAMGLHMALYPDFPMGSHVKLLTGYWALGGGILSQLEFNMLERYLRRKLGTKNTDAQSVERIARRLMESYAVFTIVPAMVLVLAVFRQVHEGYGTISEAIEVAFVGVVFVGAALIVAWRYGTALREDCREIRSALGDVGQGQFEVGLDASRPDELGLVARGITDMGQGLKVREERELKLLEITSAFSDELHLDKLLTVITTGATELLSAERSSLFLYDEEGDQLWTPVAEGLSGEIIYLAKDSGLAGACFTEQRVINLKDVSEDPRFNADMDEQTGFVTRNMICMPVNNSDGRQLGVIQVLNRRDGSFDERDEQRLRSISAQAATALENAQLFEEVLNLKNYDESILKSLSNGVISIDPALNVTKVNAAAMRTLEVAEGALVGHDLPALFYAGNAWVVELAQTVCERRKAEVALDVDIERSNGSTVSINLNVVPLHDVNDEFIGMLMILEDLSAEKRVRGTMSRYMPKAVVDQVLDGTPDVLQGQAQVMTLLFTDIRGFTSISESIGPRATVAMLNEYFSDMVDIIDQHDGILDKYIGDAIMALFGVPFSGPSDARNAVNAANGMMRALDALNERRIRAGQKPLVHGIGVNTGEAVAGSIGSPKRMDYTAIGDAVNLTARIESATKYYGTPVLLSDLTLREIDDAGYVREIDRIRVKGKAEPVTLYESFDWRVGTLSYETARAYELQRDGLERYRAQAWSESSELFTQASRLAPTDAVSPLYLERIRHYQSHAPGDDWDGVWTMQNK